MSVTASGAVAHKSERNHFLIGFRADAGGLLRFTRNDNQSMIVTASGAKQSLSKVTENHFLIGPAGADILSVPVKQGNADK